MRFVVPFLARALCWASLPLVTACGDGASAGPRQRPPAPVEVANVTRQPIAMRRSLSGTLRPKAEFTVGARVSGQLRELRARVSDPVQRGAVLALLEDEPFVQEVKRAEAELLVAQATSAEAEAQAKIAARGMTRARQLRERGIASETQYDTALAEERAAVAAVAVAKAQIARAEAALEAARIRLRFTKVKAEWTEGDDTRVIAERYVDEGDIVGNNDPMFRIVEMDPLLGVAQVTEGDYPFVRTGDPVELHVAAFPGVSFRGRVSRVAPVFSELSRQARIEFEVPNPDSRLRPGMFAEASLVLQSKDAATVVPLAAVVRRNDQNGVFLVDESKARVQWRSVRLGIQDGPLVEVLEPELHGQIVVLGQQLLEDGAPVRIVESQATTEK